jgi:hypothetical protein
MARARNIKPSFFTNEILGTLDPMVSLTFAGLWCLADKDGILEDRPIRIKGELFPYRDGLDVNGYLTVLQLHGFIVRYVVDNFSYIKVLEFQKHQHPHHTEKAKGFPQPPLQVVENIDLFNSSGSLPVVNGYGTDISRRSPSDSGFLIPENGGVSTALPPSVDNSPPPISPEFQEVLNSRPELPDPMATWLNFVAHYPQSERTMARWRKWVGTEHAPKAAAATPSITVPGPKGRDPALARLEADAARTAPMPFHIRAQISAILRKPTGEVA